MSETSETARPTAVCHTDGEPLVSTFEFQGYEFICVVCGRKYTFFEPTAATSTEVLAARHDELRALYVEQRAERLAASS